MEEQNKVSLWIGSIASEEKLDAVILEVYDENGDSSSEFMKAFNIDYIDNQFQEVFFTITFNLRQKFLKDFHI